MHRNEDISVTSTNTNSVSIHTARCKDYSLTRKQYKNRWTNTVQYFHIRIFQALKHSHLLAIGKQKYYAETENKQYITLLRSDIVITKQVLYMYNLHPIKQRMQQLFTTQIVICGATYTAKNVLFRLNSCHHNCDGINIIWSTRMSNQS